jgi:bifunctional non-homologous end joining protein LigD
LAVHPGPGAVMPTTLVADFRPVHLRSLPEPFDDPEWLFEPAYDGVRALLSQSAAGSDIRTDHDLPLAGLSDLARRVSAVLGDREAVLEGLIVALDARGKPVLRDLLRGRGFLAFAAMDLLVLDGRDVRPLPLAVRKAMLSELLPADTGPLYKVFTLEEHGRALFATARKLDLAGIVARRKDEGYGPDAVWYRIANPEHTLAQAAERAARRQRARAPHRAG